MARNGGSSTDTLSCQVCFQGLKEIGDHTPRILPCHDTVCESCLKELIRNDSTVVCPECRKKHRAPNKEKSFPPNKYILVQIQNKKNDGKEDLSAANKCKKHGKELVLYCKEELCQKPICISCLKTCHKGHELTPVEEHEKDVLIKKVRKLKKHMEAKVEIISRAKKDIFEKTDQCVQELKKTKKDFSKRIDRMIEKAEKQRVEASKQADTNLSAMKGYIFILSDIQLDLEYQKEINHKVVNNKQESLRKIIHHNRQNLCGAKSFQYPVFSTGEIGEIKHEEVTVVLPDYEAEETRINPPQIKCTVTQSINTKGLDDVSGIAWIGENTAVVCGHETKMLDLISGSEVPCPFEDAQQVVVVKLGETMAAAVFYKSRGEVEFRDVNDLSKVLCTHSLKSDQLPREVPCTLINVDSSSQVLGYSIYENMEVSYKVRWLDLRESQPKVAEEKNIIHLKHDEQNYDMCFGRHGDKQLLVLNALDWDEDEYEGELFAYNTDTGKLEWKVSDKLPGVEKDFDAGSIATDGRGHLFVCDHNNVCIQMFSVSDGKYLGCLIKDEENLGQPFRAVWCEKISSLLVSYGEDECLLKIIKIHY